MKLLRNFTQGKMDKDLDENFLRPGEYRDMLNGRVISSDADGVGVIEKFRGTLELNVPEIPDGYNVIGLTSHEDLIYYIATNNTDTLIGEYNKTADTHRYIHDSRALSEKVFVLDKDILIANMIVFEGLLIFCDKDTNLSLIHISEPTRPY